MSIMTWVVAFLAMAALDVAWVLYMRASTGNRPAQAAGWAAAIHGFSALAVVLYTDDHRYISATMLGTIAGTFAIVWWNRRKAEEMRRNPKIVIVEG